MPESPALGSAPPAPIGDHDHVRGRGEAAIVYLDLACPRCAGAWAGIRTLPMKICVRHFPVASKRPRAPALHAAAEAAGLQSEDAFWAFWDGLLEDRSHTDDPHLWQRAERAGIDVDRFDRDRRSAAVSARVRADFLGGIRAGVTGTPAAFVGGKPVAGELPGALERPA
jgi:protein-disulfide isomerase